MNLGPQFEVDDDAEDGPLSSHGPTPSPAFPSPPAPQQITCSPECQAELAAWKANKDTLISMIDAKKSGEKCSVVLLAMSPLRCKASSTTNKSHWLQSF